MIWFFCCSGFQFSVVSTTAPQSALNNPPHSRIDRPEARPVSLESRPGDTDRRLGPPAPANSNTSRPPPSQLILANSSHPPPAPANSNPSRPPPSQLILANSSSHPPPSQLILTNSSSHPPASQLILTNSSSHPPASQLILTNSSSHPPPSQLILANSSSHPPPSAKSVVARAVPYRKPQQQPEPPKGISWRI
jgi:hypothetical protein